MQCDALEAKKTAKEEDGDVELESAVGESKADSKSAKPKAKGKGKKGDVSEEDMYGGSLCDDIRSCG